MRQILSALSPEERAKKSAQIVARYTARDAFKSASTIMAYSSFGAEVDTRALLEACLKSNKRLILPRLNMKSRLLEPVEIFDLDRDLTCNKLGFCEPRAELKEFSPLIDIDEIIVPGMAFDLKLNRLGRGLGCYDRFLDQRMVDVEAVHEIDAATIEVECGPKDGHTGFTCGLAFDCQIVDEIPVDEHDQAVLSLVTESRSL